MKPILLILMMVVGLAAAIGGAFYVGMSRVKDDAPAVAVTIRPPVERGKPAPQSRPATLPTTRSTVLKPLVLTADAARLHGRVLKLTFQGRQEICYWTDQNACVDWPVNFPQPGQYRVELVMAGEPGNGGSFVLLVSDQKILGRTHEFHGAHQYHSVSIGTVTIAEVSTTLTIKASGPVRGSLMNLRAVRLIPAT